ncbi:MAG: hypothetical protein GC200_10050 [Tepidisphaera sp.]|nr:hypothetical protein [Tepidisphaera sp.]
MTRTPPPLPQDELLLDLLTEQALFGLNEADETRLHAALGRVGLSEQAASLEGPATACTLAFLAGEGVASPPAALMAKLEASGRAWCESVKREGGARRDAAAAVETRLTLAGTPARLTPARKHGGAPRWLPWLAAAAGVTLAAIAWFPLPKAGPGFRTMYNPVKVADADPKALHLAWGAWDNPEQPGVSGQVIWSETNQTGYMTFKGLKPNDPSKEQYQLWIIDSRGMQQRISGAIFDASSGETIVPIRPGIKVDGAAAFAVTIEQPGGTWVSDMKRRVVIASKG